MLDVNPKVPTINGSEKVKLQDNLDPDDCSLRQFQISVNNENIKIPYLSLFKYSDAVKEEICQHSVFGSLSSQLQSAQETFHISAESIVTFSHLLLDEEVTLQHEQFNDLCQLCDIFKVGPLKRCLTRYLYEHSSDVDFILSLKISAEKTEEKVHWNELVSDELRCKMEEILANKIDECLKNEKLGCLQVSSIYRILEKSVGDNVKSENLYEFIKKSFQERKVLLHFVNVEELSDESFDDLYEKEKKQMSCFEYLGNQVRYIKRLKERIHICESKREELEKENEKQKIEVKEMKKRIKKRNKISFEIVKKLKKTNEDLKKIEINGILSYIHQNILHCACQTENAYLVEHLISQKIIDINSRTVSSQLIYSILSSNIFIAFQNQIFSHNSK